MSPRSRTAILVPVKDPRGAKLRLHPFLRPQERSALSLAMLADLIEALRPALKTIDIFTATSSAEVAALAQKGGWQILPEPHQVSESHSIDRASRRLCRQGFEAVLRIPGDVPLVRPEDILGIVQTPMSAPGALLVPSRDGNGTNAILRTPPDLFPSRFGRNSWVLHQQEASRTGVELQIKDQPRIAFDIDDIHDLHDFMQMRSDTCTQRLLLRFRVQERLRAHAS